MTPATRLQRWGQLVLQLEREPGPIDPSSYDNDVAVRCMIDDVADRLSRREVRQLADLDERFRRVTQPSSKRLFCGHDVKRDDWWLHRVPASMSVESFQQFVAIGYL